MESEKTSWLPHSCFRRPSWRWQWACCLCRTGRRVRPPLDDAWVARAKHFLAARDRYTSRSARTKLARLDPAVQEAADLSREEPPHRRWHVEALLLTTTPFAEVARLCGVAVQTLEAFHELHFHVRPYLHATDWVMAQAVGTYHWKGFAGLPLGSLWRHAAYTAGARALEVMMAVTTGQPFPAWLRASFTQNPAYQERRLRLLGKLVVAAATTDSPAAWQALVEAHDQVRRLDRQAPGSRDEPSLLPVMEDFLLSVGGRRKPGRKTVVERPKAKGRALDLAGAGKPRRRVSVTALLDVLRR
jgi:hypothetical protein